MRKTSALLSVLAAFALAAPALADYTSIQANLIDLVSDTSFDGTTLSVMSNTANNLTLNDPTSIGGSITNLVLNLETYFDSVFFNPGPKALFVGGNVSLTFDHNGSPYELSGPISGMVFQITTTSPTLSQISGEGLFDAFADLPGSNIWPATGLSSIKSLTFAFQMNLAGFDWENGTLEGGRIESLMTFLPDDSAVPAPAALALLLPGFALLRRRQG
jgi:hypothetical protein